MSAHRRRRRHGGADKVGAAAVALTAFKIAVGSGGATLAGGEPVGVHRQTHRAARFAPLEARVGEDFVQALCFSLTFHQARAGHNQHARNVVGLEAALGVGGGGAQGVAAAVGGGGVPGGGGFRGWGGGGWGGGANLGKLAVGPAE